jgi:uncharacterized protein YkwD
MRKKVSIVVVILFIAIIGGILIFRNTESLKLKDNVFTFELGDKVSFTPKDFLHEKTSKDIINNSKLEFKNGYSVLTNNDELKSDNLDYLKVGVYEVLLKYNDESVSFTIEVKDTVAPKFKEFKDEIVLEQNSKDVDLTTFYEAEDISGVTIVVESNFDISRVGEYDATIKAVDQYKNITESQSKIKVIKYEDIKENNLTANLSGVTYKSQKRVNEENKPKELNSNIVSKNNSNSNKETSNKNTHSNNNTVSTKQESVPTYRRDIANQYVSRINAFRAENGLPELPVTKEAQAEADMRVKQIVSNFSHNSSTGFGENIGNNVKGYDFIEAWKNSWSHKNAMLREEHSAMAVSIYEVNNFWYAVVSFKVK